VSRSWVILLDMKTTNAATNDRDGFEIETCTRCGGSGQYSSCATHGTRCFKCNGAGKSHTARGAAAVAFLKTSRARAASSVVVGESVWVDAGMSGRRTWEVVTAVVVDGNNVRIEFAGASYTMHEFAASKVTVKFSTDAARSTLDAAIAYQATLTKAGKVSKRAA
jgi:hypothetical protein